MKALLFFVVITMPCIVQCWWCTGHMTICEIAKSQMDAAATGTVETLFATMSAQGPFPKSPDFMQAGCWADDLKSYDLTAMEKWHFINQPYDPSNFPIGGNPIGEENVESLIMDLEKTAKRTSNAYSLNFAVANLVHFFGDIHQPLHATELFSAIYPTGDRGGNLQTVHIDGVITKLHFIWDSICWEYNQELARPLNSSDVLVVKNLAARLMSTYNFTPEEMKVYNSTIMANESYQYAVQVAYPGTYDNMTISQDYLNRCIPVAEARVALAGYRLGNELQYIFGTAMKGLNLTSAETLHLVHKRLAQLHFDTRNILVKKTKKRGSK